MDQQVYQHISQLINDPIIERRTCTISGEQFPIYQSDINFYNKISPTINGQKFQIPLPTLCPEERARQRYTYRNVNGFFKRTCDYSKKSIIALYPEDSPYTIYHQDIRFSDVRNPFDYGMDFDFSQAFFPQFDTLMKRVPRMALVNTNSDNCQYANYVKNGKNCYMTSITYYDCENLAYCMRAMDAKDSVDLIECRHIQRSMECSNCDNLFGCSYLHESNECRDCHFSSNLYNCEHCFFCDNLANKQYCIHNQQYTKEEYMEKIQEIDTNKGEERCKQEYQSIVQNRPVKALDMINSENSFGNHIRNCENTFFSFCGENIQNAKYISGENMKDAMDMTGGTAQLVYQSTNVGLEGTSHIIGCVSVLHSHHMYYCDSCYDSSFCLGCVGLQNQSYCIFNKQYTKEEREEQAMKIIGHMKSTGERGEFFPIHMSPFAYNISRAQEQTQKRGYPWHDQAHSVFEGTGYLPQDIIQYDPNHTEKEQAEKNKQELLQSIIKCEKTGRGFRIVATELQIYVKLHRQIPTIHPDYRYTQRYARMAPKTFYITQCSQTHKDIISVYPPERKNVLSIEIYDQQVYG